MKDKESFIAHLSTHWYFYVAYALIAAFIWTYAVTLFTMDKPQEVVTVWVFAYDADEALLAEKLEDDKPDYLRHVRLSFYDREDAYANVVYQAVNEDTDILVLPESFIAEYVPIEKYLALDTGYLDKTLGVKDYYLSGDKAYGIKIFGEENEDSGLIKFTKDGTERENYYILINKGSLHMGKLNGSDLAGGVEVIKDLIKYGVSD